MHIVCLCLIWTLTGFYHYEIVYWVVTQFYVYRDDFITLLISTASLTKHICETLPVLLASIMLYLCPYEVFVPKNLGVLSFYLSFTRRVYHFVFYYQSNAFFGEDHTPSVLYHALSYTVTRTDIPSCKSFLNSLFDKTGF